MKLLITAATWEEVKPLEQTISQWEEEGLLQNHFIELSITGIGGVATAYHLMKLLPAGNWDLALQLGIAGSFNTAFPIGSVVKVTEERFADLGAEDDQKFTDVFELHLTDESKPPFEEGKLINHTIADSSLLDGLPAARGISVNQVHGNEASIERIVSKYHPDIESMEGAAFFYCCKMESIPFIEVRGISNAVEKRDRNRWNIPLAVANQNETAGKLVKELLA